MIIFSSKNTVVNTDSDYFISSGNAVDLCAPEYIIANYPFDAFTETAVINEGKILKTAGIYTIDYLSRQALAIKPRRIYPEFLLISQKKEYDLTVTVYGDYTLKVTVEFMQNAKIFTLPFYSEIAEISTCYVGTSRVISINFSDVKKVVLCSYKNDEILLLGILDADTIDFTDSIIVTKTHPTILYHKTLVTYKIENDCLKEVDKKVYRKDDDLFSIKEELIGLAFLEEVLLGGNFSDFLTSSLKEKAHLIPDYFNKIEKVITINHKETNCAVVYKDSKTYDYIVKAVKVNVADNKVTNFKILD